MTTLPDITIDLADDVIVELPPQGPPGNAGAQGPSGAQGPTGPQGPPGPSVLNKANAAATAVVEIQTAGSGRARFGTIGDDDYRVQVSADGATWRDGLLIDDATGVLAAPFGPLKRNAAATAPTAANDASQGYAPGAVWVDTATRLIYDCLDATTGAAVWAPRLLQANQPPRLRAGRWIHSGISVLAHAVSNSALIDHGFSALPLILNSRTTFDRIGVMCATAPASTAEVTQMRFGVYRVGPNGLNSPPMRVADCGVLTFGAGTGPRSIAISLTLDPGQYLLAQKTNRNGGTGTMPSVWSATLGFSTPFSSAFFGDVDPGPNGAIGTYNDATVVGSWAGWTMPADLSGINIGWTTTTPIIGLRAA